MKFCKYCGKQLEDNAFCDCEGAVNARAQSTVFEKPQPQQPTQPQQPVQQQSPYGQPVQPQQQAPSPYAAAAGAPAGDGKFVKALKEIPVIFKSFWKGSKNVATVAKNQNDYAVGVVFSVIFLLATFFGTLFMFLALKSALGTFIGDTVFNFPRIMLVSLGITVVIEALYVLVAFVGKKLFAKMADTKKAFTDSFIEFSIISIPVSIAFLLAGLSSFITYILPIAFITFAVIFMIVQLISDFKASCVMTNDTLFTLLAALFVVVALSLGLCFSTSMLVWCSGVPDMLSGLSNGLNQLSSLGSGLNSIGGLFN